jgi:hypothetical protein
MRAVGRIIIDAIAKRDEPAAQARLAGGVADRRGSRCPTCPPRDGEERRPTRAASADDFIPTW